MAKFLIVDDLFDNIITLKAVLDDLFEDINVFTATNGEAALKLAQQEVPDLILLDILMPGMDGYEVCTQLKSNAKTSVIPVVFVTALKESKQNRIKALKVGADGFLTKPLDETELQAQVKAMLKLKEANDIKEQEKVRLEKLVKERTEVLEKELVVRRKAEKELSLAEKNWLTTFDSINESILLIDNEKIIKNCNRAFQDLLGLNLDQLIGKNCELLFDKIVNDDNRICPLDNMLISRQREMAIFHVNDKTFEAYADPVFSDKDEVEGAVLILKDVSDSIKAKEAIKNERQLLRTLIDNLPSAIYVKDEKGRKLIANKADLKNIGVITEEEVIGHTDLEIFDEEVGERGFIDDMQVIHSANPIIRREEQFKTKSGEYVWMQTSKIPLLNQEGKVTGLVGIGHDITKQKTLIKDLEIAKNKAEESDRLKSAFLANMSHEIRTPMNGILGFTELLKDDNVDAEKRKLYIRNIQKSGARMLNTVNDIIEISKIEVGQVQLHNTQFKLADTITDICDFFRNEAEQKGLVLKCECPEDKEPMLINSDVSKIESIITNLIKNAIKYSQAGTIAFSLEKRQDELLFACKDEGIGIPADRQRAVFNRFEQADIEDRLALQGSGLGLAITKAYVEMLGGRIWVESELGVGSTFYFTLPLHLLVDYEPERKEEENENDNRMNTKKRILIVDDDETSLMFLQILLEPYASELFTAINGQEAVDTYKKEKPDVIFMDMKMPIKNGYEATKEIREMDTEIPIIAQSAYALGGDRELALEAGCTDYVTKPISESRLMEFLK